MIVTVDAIVADHSRTAIFATTIATMNISAGTIAVTSITGAAGIGMDGARAACSTMASFGWWCWP